MVGLNLDLHVLVKYKVGDTVRKGSLVLYSEFQEESRYSQKKFVIKLIQDYENFCVKMEYILKAEVYYRKIETRDLARQLRIRVLNNDIKGDERKAELLKFYVLGDKFYKNHTEEYILDLEDEYEDFIMDIDYEELLGLDRLQSQGMC